MGRVHSFFATTIGKKVVMAVTGIVLFGFVIVHMIGNLQLYLGRDALNAYSLFLREFLHGGGLWIARAVLLASVALHIWAATTLTITDRAARPIGYRQWTAAQSTYASRSMRWTGALLLAFVVYHLLDLTVGAVHPSFEEGDVYHNVVASFRVVPVAVFYLVAMLLLGLHLWHGTYSMLKTLGVSHPRHERTLRAVAGTLTGIVVLGNLTFPLAVLLGAVR